MADFDPRLEFFVFLVRENGYRDVRWCGDGHYAAIRPLLFTHAIIVGEVGNRNTVSTSWCYHSYEAARDALAAWDGTGEPQGWHRHPASGRRRKDGDPDREEVR